MIKKKLRVITNEKGDKEETNRIREGVVNTDTFYCRIFGGYGARRRISFVFFSRVSQN